MVETDALSTIAEIGVALAGFSAVIGVLGSRSGRSDTRVDALRLQAMLESGLMVAFFALLPVLITVFGAVALALFVLGLLSTLAGLVLVLSELRVSLEAIEFEHENVSRLRRGDGLLPPDH